MQKGPRLAQGRTAGVFTWGEQDILKLFRPGIPPEQAKEEAALASALHAAGVPSPALRGQLEVEGRPGLIYERITGPSLETLVHSRPWLLVHIARRLAETQVAIQSRTIPNLRPLRPVLERRIRRAAPLSPALQAAALRALETLPDGSALCHGDLHLGNVLHSPRGPIVIDWENAATGHPLADVARTLLLMRMGSVYPKTALQRSLLRRIIALPLSAYLRRYRQLAPAPAAALAAWQLPIAAARLCEGITEEEPHLLALVARLAE